ncbi:hypothetical protein BO71DRAFT_106241 [Aspergillus ellipticus CBS 707.79]|uniref:Uncharacterized protein n=1 Tax=Aspergillus ellipticus CBS 707.79 TaxID=1448320 RepID=A0A319EER3_9EURO|nr:hypothetical protein BO71DRAFT_106241 [Aspergillus ellipticus CBS 707.79]
MEYHPRWWTTRTGLSLPNDFWVLDQFIDRCLSPHTFHFFFFAVLYCSVTHCLAVKYFERRTPGIGLKAYSIECRSYTSEEPLAIFGVPVNRFVQPTGTTQRYWTYIYIDSHCYSLSYFTFA